MLKIDIHQIFDLYRWFMSVPVQDHFEKLKNMYLTKAPINDYFKPSIELENGRAEIIIPVRSDFFHAARSTHGCVYFKAADDAAYFAAHTVVRDFFLYTTNFNLQIIRPIASGNIRAVGHIVQNSRALIVAEAQLFNDRDKLIGKGLGNFMRSAAKLGQELGYE